MRRTTLLVVLIAFAFSCGGQWPVLQCLAWVNMVREYSETAPLSQAVFMTFSGQYPCELCKAIAEKKEEQRSKLAATASHEKKIIAPSASIKDPLPLVVPQIFSLAETFFQTVSEAPPTPPPRFA